MAGENDVEVRIGADTQSAVNNIQELVKSLKAAKAATKGGLDGIQKAAEAIKSVSAACDRIGNSGAKVADLASALKQLRTAAKGDYSGLQRAADGIRLVGASIGGIGAKTGQLASLAASLKGIGSAGNGIKNLASGMRDAGLATTYISDGDIARLDSLSRSLRGFSGLRIGKGAFSGLSQLPDVVREFSKLDMDKFANQVKRASAQLAPFARQIEKLASALKKLPQSYKTVGSAARSVTSANRNLEKACLSSSGSMGALRMSASLLAPSMSKAGKSTLSLGSAINGGLVMVGIHQIGNALATCIDKLNEYIEAMNLAQTVMGQTQFEKMAGQLDGIEFKGNYDPSTGKGDGFWSTAQDLMGIDAGEAVKYQAVFEDIITGMGVARSSAEKMSQQLTQLGYDISSFNNISVDEAMQKIQSGVSGELEPMRRIGYDLSVARQQQDALNMGIEDNVINMTQAEKVQLRYYEMITQITEAHGDLARTLNSPANQIRILQAQVSVLARNFASLLLPAMNAIVPVLTAIVKLAQQAVAGIARLFGVDLSEYFADMSTVDYSSMKSDADGIADATDDAAASTSKAAAAAKEWRKQLMGFDEINNLSPQTDSASGGSGGGGGASGGVDGLNLADLGYDFFNGLVDSQVNAMVDKIKTTLANAFNDNGFEGVGQAIGRWVQLGLWAIPWGPIQQAANSAGTILAQLMNGFVSTPNLANSVGFAIGQGVNTGVQLGLGFVKTLDFYAVGSFVGESIQKGFDTINWIGIAGIISGGINGIADLLRGGIAEIQAAADGIKVADALNKMIAGIDWGNIGLTFSDGLNGIFSFAFNVLQNFDVSAFIDGVNSMINNALEQTDWNQVGQAIGQFIGKAASAITGVVFNLETWLNIGSAIINALIGAIQGLWDSGGLMDFLTLIMPTGKITSWVGDTFKGVGKTVSEFMTNIGDNVIMEGVRKVGDWLTSKFTAIGYAFYAAVQGIKDVGASFLKSAWDKVVSVASNISEKFDWLGGTIKGIAWNAWNGITSVFGTVGSWFFDNVVNPISSAFENAYKWISWHIQNAWNYIAYVFGNVSWWFHNNVYVPIYNTFWSIVNFVKDGLNHIIWLLNCFHIDLPKAIQDITGWSSFGFNISYLATGGQVDSGQLFVARESGPEMVGTMGGKTTVANNEQIVQGIAQGVASANAEQNRLLMEQNSLLRELLRKDSGGSVSATDIGNALNTASRISGRPVVTA